MKIVLVAPDAWALTGVFDRDGSDAYSSLRLAVTPVAAYVGRPADQPKYLQEIGAALSRVVKND